MTERLTDEALALMAGGSKPGSVGMDYDEAMTAMARELLAYRRAGVAVKPGELLSCPFCGKAAHIGSEADIDGVGRFYAVRCNGCGAKAGADYASETCPIFYEGVRERWNRRTPSPAIRADADLRAETAAWALWREEAALGTPKMIWEARTLSAFRSELNPEDRERWLRNGRAVIAALSTPAPSRPDADGGAV